MYFLENRKKLWGGSKNLAFLRFLHQFLGKLELGKKLILQVASFSPEQRVFASFYYLRLIRRVINDWKMKEFSGHFLSFFAFIPLAPPDWTFDSPFIVVLKYRIVSFFPNFGVKSPIRELLAARYRNGYRRPRKHNKKWVVRKMLIKSRNNYIMKNPFGDFK